MTIITKSWALTLFMAMVTVLVPFANDLLQPYGITVTENEIFGILAAFGITSGVGAKVAMDKRRTRQRETAADASAPVSPENARAQTPTPVQAPAKHDVSDVRFGPRGAWYQTNFERGAAGNKLDYGQSYLWVKVPGARSYVTAILKNEKGIPIQVDQSHSKDEDRDITTTRIELFTRNGKPLPRGKYMLQTQADTGSGDSQGVRNDEFHIE